MLWTPPRFTSTPRFEVVFSTPLTAESSGPLDPEPELEPEPPEVPASVGVWVTEPEVGVLPELSLVWLPAVAEPPEPPSTLPEPPAASAWGATAVRAAGLAAAARAAASGARAPTTTAPSLPPPSSPLEKPSKATNAANDTNTIAAPAI